MSLQSIIYGLEVEVWLKLLALAGAALTWLIANRKRPRLEAFFTHGASHRFRTNPPAPPAQPQAGQPQNPLQPAAPIYASINSHTLVIRNAGRTSANNVRVTHPAYPPETNVQIYPDQPFAFNHFGVGGMEFVFERLRPRDQLTISYLYPGTFLLSQFNTTVRYDDGHARFFKIQHVRLLPPWAYLLVGYLLLGGLTVTIYYVAKGFLFLFFIP